MNKDQVSGKVEQVTGRVKEKVGETVGNQGLANQGVADQVKGAAKETWGNAKDAANTVEDRHRREAEQKATHARENIVASVTDTKDRIKEGLDDKARRA